MNRAVLTLIFCLLTMGAAAAQPLSGLARVDAGRSLAVDVRGGLALDVHLSVPVPYRVYTLADPYRLVLEFREVDWEGLDPSRLAKAKGVEEAAVGQTTQGWSQMALRLSRPFKLTSAGMATSGADGTDGVTVEVRLEKTDEASFRAASGAPPDVDAVKVQSAQKAQRRDPSARRIIVLDPGHGGIDSGAVEDGHREADLILAFARELKETLIRTGRYEVILTRDEDVFVSLEGRVAFAHQVGADVFISLHADTLPEGGASGTTVYTLSDTATDEASEKLAERHDRQDMLLGVDLSKQDDTIAQVLFELARIETSPRSDQLARAILKAIEKGMGRMNSKPLREAGFSVLKSPDIPSILIELGFMSSSLDLLDLTSVQWRVEMAQAVASGLEAWMAEDAANQLLLRH